MHVRVSNRSAIPSTSATLNLQGIPSGQYQLRLTAGSTLVDIHTLIVQ